MTLLALLIISLAATGLFVVIFLVPGAIVAAIFVAVFYGMLVAVRIHDRRALASGVKRVGGAAGAGAIDQTDEPEGMEIEPDVPEVVVVAERAGFRVGLAIVAPLAALALLLAAVLVGWKVVGLGALAFFAIMLFMGAPVWLAAVEDEIDEAEERIGNRSDSIR